MQMTTVKYLIVTLLLLQSFIQTQQEFLTVSVSNLEQIEGMFQKADKLIKEKKWEEAAKIYEKIMAEYLKSSQNKKDILIKVNGNLHRNVRDLIWANLKHFPIEALKKYDKMLSSKAISYAKNNKNELLINNFLFTKTGTEALRKACDNYILKEEYEQAIRCAFIYINHSAKNSSENASMLSRLAFCYFATNNIAGLKNVIGNIKKNLSEQKIKIAEKEITISSYVRGLYREAKKNNALMINKSEWPMMGGNSQRNYQKEQNTYPSLVNPKSIILPQPPIKRDRSFFTNEQNRPKQGPIQYYPTIADNTLFINNSKSIFAYELPSLKLKWKYEGIISQIKSDWHEQVIHSITYHDGAIYANIEGTTDQKKQFWEIYLISKILAERRLVKLDARTGRVIWIVKEDPKRESFENKISFMGPPIPWQNKLIVAAASIEGLFNSYILALDPKTGKTLWSKLIGSAHQELNLFNRPVRESVGSKIATAHGKIYYLTNLGGIACLDPETSAISWVYKYQRIHVNRPTQAIYHTIYRDTGWYNGPTMVSGEKIYVAPLDSNYLYCLNSKTGEEIWKHRRGYKQRYLMGIFDNKVIIGSENKITLISAKTGKMMQNFNIGKIAGLGIILGHTFYCPGYFYMYTINLKTMHIDKHPWPRLSSPGHLTFANNTIVMTSSNRITTFLDVQTLIAEHNKKIKLDPKNISNYIKIADLYSQFSTTHNQFLQKSELFYLRAKKLSQKEKGRSRLHLNEEINKKLLDVYQKMAVRYKQSDKVYNYYKKILQLTNDKYISIPLYLKLLTHYEKKNNTQKIIETLRILKENYGQEEYLISKQKILINLYVIIYSAKYYIKLKKYSSAIHEYQKLIMNYPQKKYEGIFCGKYAYSKIQKLIKTQGRSIYRTYDQKAELLQQNSSNTIHWEIFSKYPNSKIAPTSSLKVANNLISKKLYNKAIIHLNHHVRLYQHLTNNVLDAYYLLIRCYEIKKQFNAAYYILYYMKKNFSNNDIIIDGKKISVDLFVKDKWKEEAYNDLGKDPMPAIEIDFNNFVKRKMRLSINHKSHKFIIPTGKKQAKYNTLVFMSVDTPKDIMLQCYNTRTYKVMWESYLGWPIRGIEFIKDYIIVWNDKTIFAVKPENGNIIWKTKTTSLTTLHILDSKIYALNNQRLKCEVVVRDYRSGNILWKHKFNLKIPITEITLPEIVVTKDLFIITFVHPSQMVIFSTKTGKILKTFSDNRRHQNLFFYPILLNANYLAILANKSTISCYKIPEMKKMWQIDEKEIERFSIKGNDQYISWATKKQISLTNIISGQKKWTQEKSNNEYVQQVFFDYNNFYFSIENIYAGYLLTCIDADSNSLMWQTSMGKSIEIPKIIITEKYILSLANRWARGYRSYLNVYNKSNGKLLKNYESNNGNRGRNAAEMQVVNNQVWLLQDSNIWIIGK